MINHQLEIEMMTDLIVQANKGNLEKALQIVINVYGWQAVLKQLSEMAEEKEDVIRQCGFDSKADTWEVVKTKLKEVARRRVME